MSKYFKIGAIISILVVVVIAILEDFFHIDRGIAGEAIGVVAPAIWPVLIAVLGIMLFFEGFISLNHKRLIQNIPTSKIGSLALGLVEINGRSYPLSIEPLKSPYSNTDCVFYHYKVQQSIRDGGWQTIGEASSGVPFYVDDGSGRVLVVSQKAEVRLAMRYISYSPDKKQDSPILSTSGKSMRYLESFIIPGESVYVLGTARKAKNHFIEHGRKVTRKLIDWWNTSEKREEFDLNQDGGIDKQEYTLMTEKAEELISEEEKGMGIQSKMDLSGLSDIIITKGEEEKTFIISNENEKEVISKIGAKVIFYIVGGIFLTLTGVVYLYCLLNR